MRMPQSRKAISFLPGFCRSTRLNARSLPKAHCGQIIARGACPLPQERYQIPPDYPTRLRPIRQAARKFQFTVVLSKALKHVGGVKNLQHLSCERVLRNKYSCIRSLYRRMLGQYVEASDMSSVGALAAIPHNCSEWDCEPRRGVAGRRKCFS